MTKRRIIIATRESPLALAQAESIKTLLLTYHPHLSVELLGITTQADKHLEIALTEIGGKGLFIKELEEALLDGRADVAVHSMKDVPMELPPGLVLPVIGKREEPRDVFVSNQYVSLAQMPSGASVGTSSLRRQTQLQAIRQDLDFLLLRGNINTRLSRLDKNDFDAIILAAAGLKRMNLESRICDYLSMEQSLPSAGQGALGIECREEDEKVLTLIAPLNDNITHACVSAERALCRRLGGGCKVPVAAYAEIHHRVLSLRGLVANHNGTKILRAALAGDPCHAESIGMRVAEELLQQGAEKILQAFQ
ncbi:MAG: hydroxymethylbilane synthase [Gammaproteobacteria bacterium]|nr:hydroxymethylbilane synthase [Gammaproteobacteria bacterium]MCW5582522.1 hydroxymethylbilane synthase [Gammaproteobacteria bacterium]